MARYAFPLGNVCFLLWSPFSLIFPPLPLLPSPILDKVYILIIVTEFSGLADKYKAVNLGQGFPNFDGPEFVLQAHKKAIEGGAIYNQYTRSGGHIRLVEVCEKYQLKMQYDKNQVQTYL